MSYWLIDTNQIISNFIKLLLNYYTLVPDTEDASETDMAKLEEEFTEMKEQYVKDFC